MSIKNLPGLEHRPENDFSRIQVDIGFFQYLVKITVSVLWGTVVTPELGCLQTCLFQSNKTMPNQAGSSFPS